MWIKVMWKKTYIKMLVDYAKLKVKLGSEAATNKKLRNDIIKMNQYIQELQNDDT